MGGRRGKRRVSKSQRDMAAAVLLSEDLIFTEILPRLPIKAILDLKAVCKSWLRAITSDLRFAVDQWRRCSSAAAATSMVSTLRGQFVVIPTSGDGDGDAVFCPLDDLAGGASCSILSASHGLLCILVSFKDMPNSSWFYYLWNPVLGGEGVRVPFTPPLPSRVMYRTGFVHDPYGSDYNHFKLVCPFRRRRGGDGRRRWGFCVFDSGAAGGWAKIGDDKDVVLGGDNINLRAPFHMGGVLYWHLFGGGGCGRLLSFDPRGGGEGIAGVVQPPPGNRIISVLSQQEDGRLTFVEFTNVGVQAWCLLKQQGGEQLGGGYEWERLCSVRLLDAINRHERFFFSRCPFTSHLRHRYGGNVSTRLWWEHRIIHATCSPDKVYLRFRRFSQQHHHQQQQQRHILHEFILTYDIKEDIWGQFFPKALAQDQNQFFYLHCSLLPPPKPKF